MVTTLVPISSGACADQLIVPEAAPEGPVEVDHVTAVTPTLSLAVPVIEIVCPDVDTMVEPGDTTTSVGGVVSLPPAGADGVGGAGLAG